MAQDNSSNKTIATKRRGRRTSFTEDHLKILTDTFNKTPDIGYASRQRLALETNTKEFTIQYCFQNRRTRHGFQKKSEPEEHLESSQDRDHAEEKIQSRNDRQPRIKYTCSQLHTLNKAFIGNNYPGRDSIEKLAKEIGVSESRVKVWFQNHRSSCCIQRKKEANEGLEQRQNQGQDLCDESLEGIEST
ncbi:double homeobox protein A-like [Eubalaena glacialis]|uniref:double homeobox protein A-like n=1 Tax=Eubalaena glacialis TaxID=27606 RepID=UPI002A599587|nr:double homeobox protein A-like [Eubalaena glacialis]